MSSLYKNDKIPSVKLNKEQKEYIELVQGKIESKVYQLEAIECLCKVKSTSDIVIAEKDRYGFDVKNILCKNCGLIRSEKILDEFSLRSFYINEYRKIYQADDGNLDSFFANQKKIGLRFYNLFFTKVGHLTDANFFEIGCGAGGIMMAFQEAGYNCKGSDFNVEYLNYGKRMGLFLEFGDYQELIQNESQDVMMLSHVLEHLKDPIVELINIFEKIKPNGYLIVEVPGIFSIHKVYFNPILYFQNAHVYNFFEAYFREIAAHLGVNVIYGDEKCTFIFQKNKNHQPLKESKFAPINLKEYQTKIHQYLRNTKNKYLFRLNFYFWKTELFKLYKKLK